MNSATWVTVLLYAVIVLNVLVVLLTLIVVWQQRRALHEIDKTIETIVRIREMGLRRHDGDDVASPRD